MTYYSSKPLCLEAGLKNSSSDCIKLDESCLCLIFTLTLCTRDIAVRAPHKLVGAKQDGAVGQKTMQAAINQDSAEMIDMLHDTRQKFHESLSHYQIFGRGWTHHNRQSKKEAQKMLRP